MEVAKEVSYPNAMPKEVQNGCINDQLEAHSGRNPRPPTRDYAVGGFRLFNDSRAEANDKVAAAEDANSVDSGTLESGRLSLLSGSWKQWLLLPASSLHSHGQHDTNPRPWTTTFFRFGPLSGLFCLILALASIVASLGILAGSDQQTVASWSVTPPTYLAVFTAIANLSVRYAAYQGIIVAWWYRASKGSKLSKLHHDWRSGMSIRGALSSGRNIGMLGLACVFSTIVVIDGPLLQRSSRVSVVERTRSTHFDVTMAPEIPTGFGGHWKNAPKRNISNGGLFNSTWPTPDGTATGNIDTVASWHTELAAQLWTNQLPLEGAVRGCPSSLCKAKIKAPALFPTACSSQLIPSQFYETYDVGAVIDGVAAPPLKSDYFIIDFNLMPTKRETINLITAYWTGDENCEGTLNLTVCTLESGIGEYDFVVNYDKAFVDPDSALQPAFVAFANNTFLNQTQGTDPWKPSTLAGVEYIVSVTYGTFGCYSPGVAKHLNAYGAGWTTPRRWIDFKGVENRGCPSYLDPRNDVLRGANMLMVYVGFMAGANYSSHAGLKRMDPGLEINSTVIGSVHETHNIFHTNYWFFMGAAVVEIVCVALIAPTYWGWWRFGRPISYVNSGETSTGIRPASALPGGTTYSAVLRAAAVFCFVMLFFTRANVLSLSSRFSPVEMAKAFDSPMLADYDLNASGNDLARALGDQRVRYGATTCDSKNGKSKLVFADPDLVVEPQRSAPYNSR